MAKSGAKHKLLEYFREHVGEVIPRDTLRSVAGNIIDWQRVIRTIRQETGLDIKSNRDGYVLTSLTPIKEPIKRGAISQRLRYAVLKRDNSTCQRCGRSPSNTKGLVLHVDHIIPVDLGRETTLDNLWTLCMDCNEGKKAFFSDEHAKELKEILSLDSGYSRLVAYFKLHANEPIDVDKLAVIAGIRDWERTLRYIRKKEGMQITYKKGNKDYPIDTYTYYE